MNPPWFLLKEAFLIEITGYFYAAKALIGFSSRYSLLLFGPAPGFNLCHSRCMPFSPDRVTLSAAGRATF